MNRAVFLDRDGVINRKMPEGRYVTSWAEMRIFPGAADAITLLQDTGYKVIVVSNQRCVAKGLVTASELENMHHRMRRELASSGAVIDAVYYCPHEKFPPCSCRKPSPGMLLTAAHEHKIDLAESWMIGDSEDDVQAGKNAGCRTARILGDQMSLRTADADIISHSLLGATLEIVRSGFLSSCGLQEKHAIAPLA